MRFPRAVASEVVETRERTWQDMQRPGEQNGMARITAEDVMTIRNLHGIATAVSLGREYGLSHVSISRIWNRERWGHV